MVCWLHTLLGYFILAYPLVWTLQKLNLQHTHSLAFTREFSFLKVVTIDKFTTDETVLFVGTLMCSSNRQTCNESYEKKKSK